MNNLSIRKMNEISKKKKGFTLVELIIVIAIIAILAAMAIPKFSAVRIDAKVSNDLAAAKNIQSATATMVANGTIKAAQPKLAVPGAAGTTGEEIAKRVASNNGSALAPEAISGATFNVTVTADGDVTVVVTASDIDYQLVPEPSTSTVKNKSDYAKAASTPVK